MITTNSVKDEIATLTANLSTFNTTLSDSSIAAFLQRSSVHTFFGMNENFLLKLSNMSAEVALLNEYVNEFYNQNSFPASQTGATGATGAAGATGE